MTGTAVMPANFQYADVLAKGYPAHKWTDSFRLKHPSMENSRRAKIFSPFDALKGFNEAVAAKEVLYENRRILDSETLEELNRRLSILHNLTANSRLARQNSVPVAVMYFVPCQDKNHSAYGYRGQYVTITGIVRRITASTIVVDEEIIPLSAIVALESEFVVPDSYTGEQRRIFDEVWCD